MRKLFAVGRITKRTQVCAEGENSWDNLENFPELLSADQDLSDALQRTRATPSAEYERRLWGWLALLLTLYVVYAVIHFR